MCLCVHMWPSTRCHEGVCVEVSNVANVSLDQTNSRRPKHTPLADEGKCVCVCVYASSAPPVIYEDQTHTQRVRCKVVDSEACKSYGGAKFS